MHHLTAYERRESLTALELERLEAALAIEVERYRDAIRNYPPDRMEKHGAPYLAKLQEQVAVVQRLRAGKGD